MLKRENSISISYKTKVARMLFIVVIIFIILHIPFTALIFIRNYRLKSKNQIDQIDGWFYILWYTSHYLLYLNAAVNPIIYGLTNDNFRRAYHQTPLLPQRIRLWSTLAKKLQNINRNEVRKAFCAVHSHSHRERSSSALAVFNLVIVLLISVSRSSLG